MSDPAASPEPAPSVEPDPGPDPTLERWRLVLGEPAQNLAAGGLSAQGAARDAALEWLYQRDPDLARRGVRPGSAGGGRGQGGDGSQAGASREGGSQPSVLATVDWLDDIHRLFPHETIERLERDAVERYGLHEVVTDPGVLARIEPNPTLLRAVLRTKHLMNPQVLRLARRIVEQVVADLVAALATQVRSAFSGARSRHPSRFARAASFDFRRTIHDNLGHWDPDQRRLYIESARFFARTSRELDRWQLILVVDQSGSMAGSVIHSAVTAACLWGVPGLRTHLLAFDTAVVDLSADVDDPVELLLKVQLGGGTDIARAAAYAAQLIDQPRRAIVVLVTDFYEGGDAAWLVRTVRGLVEQGTRVLGLAALDEEATPAYNRELAQRLADVGAQVGSMTPALLAEFVAGTMAGR